MIKTFKTPKTFANFGFQMTNFENDNDADILITFGVFYRRLQFDFRIKNLYKLFNRLPCIDFRIVDKDNKGNWIIKRSKS